LKSFVLCFSGLLIAFNYKTGQTLLQDRSFKKHEKFFQEVFEIGRRYKIMNPEKMRSEYGKLVYLLQDSVMPNIKELLEFNCVLPIKTVYSFLEKRNCLQLLKDKKIAVATGQIIDDKKKSRRSIQREIRRKEKAIKQLSKEYASTKISGEEIQRCLYSIGDNHAYLASNRDPVDAMIAHLKTYFDPEKVDSPQFSLAISAANGSDGARLTHNHARQYHYVLQSLTLWREILHDMFRLWYLSEEDLLDGENPYKLRNTGQGLHRVQRARRISKAMHSLLYACQQKVGYCWVGSSVIHLGDDNVPNALMFIDKYNQISRILNPIVLVIKEIDAMCKHDGIEEFMNDSFQSKELLKKTILCDFFRHGFDGSGADNFFEAGSCIDGRLTSAWNWCSLVNQKPYFHIFKLAGFIGFDGDFQA